MLLDVAEGEPVAAPTVVGSRGGAVVVDLFCGAGSLSAGIDDALTELGYRPAFTAVNHWDIATQTYARNHPGARVHCVTLDAAFPAHLIPDGVVDLLAAGIECTFFSRARGGKPISDQQRMSAWHVVRWCTELRVKRLLLENVPEFTRWGPVDPKTGKAIKEREGEYFRAWWAALEAIGYRMELKVVNCADNGDATTRKRLFMLGTLFGKPIPWPAASHAPVAAPRVRRWRTARDIIDWSIRGVSIFDRPKPLAEQTLRRIWAGLIKFKWPEPFLVVLRQHCDALSIDLPLPTICAGGTHIGLVQPFTFANRTNNVPKGADTPIGAITTTYGGGFALVEPFVLSQASGGAARSTSEPVQTIPCGGAHALVAPYYSSGSGETCTSVDEPLPTATTMARFGLVIPVTHSDSSNRARDIDQPIPTLTTAKRGELAFILGAFGERAGQSPRVHSVDVPAPTICAQGRTPLVVGGDAPGRRHDILYRMFQPHELAAAMSISTPDSPYHFVGNKTQVIRQIGQAVPRRTAAALARALMGVEE